jgi:thiol-disulfide isomerase/thioredoxin
MLVVCLCAEWCGVCRDYLERFETVKARFPQVHFAWVDVEDRSDLIDPLDVDDFPTLLVARAGEPVFFGPIRPQAEALERLLQDRLTGTAAIASMPREVADLVLRLRAAL